MVEWLVVDIKERMSRHGFPLPDDVDAEWPSGEEYGDAWIAAMRSAAEDVFGRANEITLPRLAQDAEQHARVLDRWGSALAAAL